MSERNLTANCEYYNLVNTNDFERLKSIIRNTPLTQDS